jgi:hypothetical protein
MIANLYITSLFAGVSVNVPQVNVSMMEIPILHFGDQFVASDDGFSHTQNNATLFRELSSMIFLDGLNLFIRYTPTIG